MEDIFDKIGKPADIKDGKVVAKEEETIEEKVEETVDTTEQKVETKAENETKEAKDSEKAEVGEESKVENPEFSFDSFKGYVKSKYEKEIDTEEKLKDYFDKAEQYETLKKEVEALAQTKAELETLAKGVDGRSWFASDDEFIRQQFLKNSEGKFSESALGVLSNLSPEKVGKMSAIDAIKAQMMVDYPDMEKHEVEELVMSELGVDDLNQEEWESLPKAKMKKMAKDAKSKLSSLYEGIEIPKAVDIQTDRETRKTTWDKPVDALVDGITKLELSEDLAFDLTSDMKEGLKDVLMSNVLMSRKELNEDSLGQLAGAARSYLLEQNFDSVLQVVRDTISEQEKEKWQAKVHNPSSLNESKRSEAPNDGGALKGRAILDAF